MRKHLLFIAQVSVAFLSTIGSIIAAFAGEKIFLQLPQMCVADRGAFRFTPPGEDYLLEVIGPVLSMPFKICDFICRDITIHNFRTVCRGGMMTAPEFHVAYFANDPKTAQRNISIISNQFSYLPDGARNRSVLPPGYAPLTTDSIDNHLKRISWDDANQRPLLARTPTDDQERRIRALFPSRGQYVEPFPFANIKLAIGISQEKPPPLAVQPSVPSASSPPTSISVSGPLSPASGLQVHPNSWSAIGIGVLLVSVMTALSGAAARTMMGQSPGFWRQTLVQSTASIISSCALYPFGLVNEFTWFAIPLIGGFSVALISSSGHGGTHGH